MPLAMKNCDRTPLNELSDRVSLALIERDSHLLYLGRITANQNDQNRDDMTNEVPDEEDMKPEMPSEMLSIQEISNTNLNKILPLLNEPETCVIDEEADEECVMSYTQFAMPWKATEDGLIKREIDAISGNMPFFNTVNIMIYSHSILMKEIENIHYWKASYSD